MKKFNATAMDLTFGEDIRGDHALFIHERHFPGDGWTLDQEAKNIIGRSTRFFRIITDEGQTREHGWIENGKIIQWG